MIMPIEYLSLLVMTIFFLFAWFPTSVGKARSYGLKWLASNRHSLPAVELPRWAQRCERAYQNLKDYFPAFVVAILLLGLNQKFDQVTAIAAVCYVGARLMHFTAYAMGNFKLRFGAFILAMGCNLLLLIKVLM